MSDKRKRETATLATKMEILRKLDGGTKVSDVAKHYNMPRTAIYSILRSRYNIENVVTNAETGPGQRQIVRRAEFEQLEKVLYAWIVQERQRNAPITGDLVRQKALSLYRKVYGIDGDFRASEGWFFKFKHRYGIRMLTVTGEKLSSDQEAVAPFVQKFEETVEEMGLTPDQLYNADESGLFWRLMPRRVYVLKNEKAADGRKVAKDRITFMPCANAFGSHKLTMLVVGKSRCPRAFKNVRLPVIYKNQSRAWMTKVLFQDWFISDFVPQVRSFLRGKNLPQTALLVVDNAPGHDPGEDMQSDGGKIKVIFLPPNCTPLLQPMDRNVIQSIKNKFKKCVLLNVIGRDCDIALSLKQMNLKDVVFTLAQSWNEVSAKEIHSSWKKLCPSFSSTGEDGNAWELEDDVPLADLIAEISGRIQTQEDTETELQREDIEDWCAGTHDVIELTDEELIAEVGSHLNEQETHMEVEEEGSSWIGKPTEHTVKSDEALLAVDLSIRWGEKNSADDSTIMPLRKLRTDILFKLYRGKKQLKIDQFITQS